MRDSAVATQINALAGKRVVLDYEQHKFVPSSCFAETEYYVVRARSVEEATAPTVPAVAPPLTPAPTPTPSSAQTPAAAPAPAY